LQISIVAGETCFRAGQYRHPRRRRVENAARADQRARAERGRRRRDGLRGGWVGKRELHRPHAAGHERLGQWDRLRKIVQADDGDDAILLN
jgi:hypothetical protein